MHTSVYKLYIMNIRYYQEYLLSADIDGIDYIGIGFFFKPIS